jgi:hypothetical protein
VSAHPTGRMQLNKYQSKKSVVGFSGICREHESKAIFYIPNPGLTTKAEIAKWKI